MAMDPRISFSNDFADAHHGIKYQTNYREAPVSSDFEFSVKNLTTTRPADEIFFKGSLVPLKEKKMTLREELLLEDEDEFGFGFQKGSSWWKLGLKKGDQIQKKSVFVCGDELLITKKKVI